jgi:hypothetical protein
MSSSGWAFSAQIVFAPSSSPNRHPIKQGRVVLTLHGGTLPSGATSAFRFDGHSWNGRFVGWRVLTCERSTTSDMADPRAPRAGSRSQFVLPSSEQSPGFDRTRRFNARRRIILDRVD